MAPLIWEHRPEGLRAPALVCAFTGWNDAADASSIALEAIATSLGAEKFASIDPEEFFDFTAARPTVRIVDGTYYATAWPPLELHVARVPRAPRDLVLLSGAEPALKWRTFCEAVSAVADALDVQTVITLGALLADVPHTRPVHITGICTDEQLAEKLDLHPATYEGPTGIVGVLHGAFARAGMPAASLWASCPHYVSAAPNPRAALALVRKFEGLVGISVDAGDLEERAASYERQVTQAVDSDPEVREFVERLERAADEEDDPSDPSHLPSGDVLARDFQRFLRQRGED